MNLIFSDGIEIDTGGNLRTLELKDGWYITGEGHLIPVRDELTAYKEIERMCPVRFSRTEIHNIKTLITWIRVSSLKKGLITNHAIKSLAIELEEQFKTKVTK